ncbi:MAG: hypothetical protein HY291_04190 [Planctomycetes bacterium]|nr:hypothetical protein [Planctomycetota bacterium]
MSAMGIAILVFFTFPYTVPLLLLMFGVAGCRRFSLKAKLPLNILVGYSLNVGLCMGTILAVRTSLNLPFEIFIYMIVAVLWNLGLHCAVKFFMVMVHPESSVDPQGFLKFRVALISYVLSWIGCLVSAFLIFTPE